MFGLVEAVLIKNHRISSSVFGFHYRSNKLRYRRFDRLCRRRDRRRHCCCRVLLISVTKMDCRCHRCCTLISVTELEDILARAMIIRHRAHNSQFSYKDTMVQQAQINKYVLGMP